MADDDRLQALIARRIAIAEETMRPFIEAEAKKLWEADPNAHGPLAEFIKGKPNG